MDLAAFIDRYLETARLGRSDHSLGEAASQNRDELFRFLGASIDKYTYQDRLRLYSLVAPLNSPLRAPFFQSRLRTETSGSGQVLLRTLIQTFGTGQGRDATGISDTVPIRCDIDNQPVDVARAISQYLGHIARGVVDGVSSVQLYCQQARVFEHLETAIETYTADERKRLYMFLLSYGDQPRLKAFLIRRKRIEGDLECRRTIETLLRHISASEGSLE